VDALENAGLMIRSLDMESLMEAARRRTGLTNFGDIAFHEPLRRLLDSCKNETHQQCPDLTAEGPLRSNILEFLINNLPQRATDGGFDILVFHWVIRICAILPLNPRPRPADHSDLCGPSR
jgi:hypothetical protein